MSPPLHFIACPLAHSSVYSTSLPHDWLLHVPTNLFPSIWAHSFSLLLQLYCTIGQTVCLHRWLHPLFLLLLQYPLFYYCNNTTAVHILIILPPCPVHPIYRKYTSPSNDLIVQSSPPETPPPPPHWSVVGTWTTVSSTAKIDTNARIPTWYQWYRLHPTHRP